MERNTITVAELSEFLGISKPTAYKLVETSDFPLIRVGSRKIIPKAAFEDWFEKHSSVNGRSEA